MVIIGIGASNDYDQVKKKSISSPVSLSLSHIFTYPVYAVEMQLT